MNKMQRKIWFDSIGYLDWVLQRCATEDEYSKAIQELKVMQEIALRPKRVVGNEHIAREL